MSVKSKRQVSMLSISILALLVAFLGWWKRDFSVTLDPKSCKGDLNCERFGDQKVTVLNHLNCDYGLNHLLYIFYVPCRIFTFKSNCTHKVSGGKSPGLFCTVHFLGARDFVPKKPQEGLADTLFARPSTSQARPWHRIA